MSVNTHMGGVHEGKYFCLSGYSQTSAIFMEIFILFDLQAPTQREASYYMVPVYGRRGNKGAAWQPSCQLAEING